MKKENEVIDFDVASHDNTMLSLQMLADRLNIRPYEGSDPLSLSRQAKSGIVNECFKSSCDKLGIVPSLAFFKQILYKNPQQLTAIVTAEVMAVLNKQNLHPVVIKSALKDYEPVIAEFVRVLSRLSESYSSINHLSPGVILKRVNQIEDYLTFVKGLATISEGAKELIKEYFSTHLDSEARQEAFDSLKGIADAINQFNANITKRGTNMKFMVHDPNYFNLENDLVIPDNSNIKHF